MQVHWLNAWLLSVHWCLQLKSAVSDNIGNKHISWLGWSPHFLRLAPLFGFISNRNLKDTRMIWCWHQTSFQFKVLKLKQRHRNPGMEAVLVSENIVESFEQRLQKFQTWIARSNVFGIIESFFTLYRMVMKMKMFRSCKIKTLSWRSDDECLFSCKDIAHCHWTYQPYHALDFFSKIICF